MPESENSEELVPVYEHIRDGISYYKVYEIEGQTYQVGLPPDDELEGEDYVPDPNEDPEAWRIYADVMDWEQIAWLRHHPEHDFGHYVSREDEFYEEQVARTEAQNPSRRSFSPSPALTPTEVRELALSLPGTQERPLAGHPAFFVERVFAVLWPQEQWVHLLLTVEMQRELMARSPHIYSWPSASSQGDRWAKTGATRVHLEHISHEEMLAALTLAHSLALPTELVFPEDLL